MYQYLSLIKIAQNKSYRPTMCEQSRVTRTPVSILQHHAEKTRLSQRDLYQDNRAILIGEPCLELNELADAQRKLWGFSTILKRPFGKSIYIS